MESKSGCAGIIFSIIFYIIGAILGIVFLKWWHG